MFEKCLKNCNLCINVEKITVKQRRNHVTLSMLKQSRNLTLKQRLFWIDTKINFVLLLYSTDTTRRINVEITLIPQY